MPSSRLPAFGSSMPKSLVLLLAEWQSRDLNTYRSFKFQAGDNALAQGYGKRKYLFDTIASKALIDGSTVEEAAVALDRVRMAEKKTVTKYYRDLLGADDCLVRRAKRPKAASPERRRIVGNPAAAARRPQQPARARRPALLGRARQLQQEQYRRSIHAPPEWRPERRGTIIDGMPRNRFLQQVRNPTIPNEPRGHTSNNRWAEGL